MKSAGLSPPSQYQPPQQPPAPPAYGQVPPSSNYYAYGGAPNVYQQPIGSDYGYYYDDYYGDGEEISAGNKAVAVLFTITVVLCFLAVGFYFYQEWQKKNNPTDNEDPGAPPRKATLRGHLKNLDEFKKQLAERMADRTAGVREQIKTRTIKANEKLKVKAAEVKTRLSRRASKHGDDSIPQQAQNNPAN